MVSGLLSVVKFVNALALDERVIRVNVSAGANMVGPIITFLGVCVLVTTFMWIAHRFLRAAEEPEDIAREERLRELVKPNGPPSENPRQPQWAH